MDKYCEGCEEETLTKIIQKGETYEVLGEIIEVETRVCVCEQCNEELYCEGIDNATLTEAYNKYRKNHKLLLFFR